MSDALKITKKSIVPGTELIKINNKSTHLYVMQSGRALLNTSKENIYNLMQLTAGQLVGEEHVLSSQTLASYTALAVEPCTVIEIPLKTFQTQLELSNPKMTAIIRGIHEKQKALFNALKAIKAPQEPIPCPADLTSKLFGVIFHTARFTGRKQEDHLNCKWSEFLDYAVNIFAETEYRLKNGLTILAKLGYAKLDFNTWEHIEFKDMWQIEAFFEFYQNYYFKGGQGSILKTNDKITSMTKAILQISAEYKPDRSGVVRMPFKESIDKLKEILGKTFEADSLFRLEQKGLMIKRIATQEGGILSFYRADFEQMLLNWKLLKEIERWNVLGYVPLEESSEIRENTPSTESHSPEEMSLAEKLNQWKPLVAIGKVPAIRYEPPGPDELLCPTCMSIVTEEQIHCSICDNLLKDEEES